ncbi:hypothetical protein EsH8_X_000156 [Colletotrichum jinshuiense]
MTQMDLSKLAKKTLKVSRGFNYTYYASPAQEKKPTITLFHGWPDTASLWAGLINDYLVPNGFGVIAIDCLGYGGTSKPTDKADYGIQRMATDVVEILDAEKLDKVVSLGHDWGCFLAQRFYNFYPLRVSALVMVNVAYISPTADFDLDEVNEATKQAFGRGIYEYWQLFGADDGAEIMNHNLEAVYSVAFGDPYTWFDNWCTPGGMRKWVSEGRTQPTLPYATPEHKADFMDRFSKDGGFEGPQCWYKAMAFKLQNEAEKEVPEDLRVVKVPTYFWGGDQDVT